MVRELAIGSAVGDRFSIERIVSSAKGRRQVGEKATAAAKKAAGEERKVGTKPAHTLAEYAGEYAHPAYGSVIVTANGESLSARFHDMPMRLNHWHFETFRADLEEKSLAELKLWRMFDLTEGLIRRKYSDRDIELILGGNFKRVLADIWKRNPATPATTPK